MNNKILASILGILLAGGCLAAWQLLAHSNLQQEQLASFEDYVAQLQGERESFAEQQIAYETELSTLRREQTNSQSKIRELESELELAKAQIDPDVIQLEQQIRERLIVEMQQPQTQAPSRTDLLRQLTALDPNELGQLMSIQGLYGGFLNELDVDEQRMDVIVDGLSNIIQEQNQLRMDAIEEMRNSPDRSNVRALRRQMRALSSPEAQLEALSYLLTEEELDIYQQYQQQQQQSGAFSTQTFAVRQEGIPFRIGNLRETNDVIIQDGQGQTQAFQIITAEPAPQ